MTHPLAAAIADLERRHAATPLDHDALFQQAVRLETQLLKKYRDAYDATLHQRILDVHGAHAPHADLDAAIAAGVYQLSKDEP